MLFTPEIVKLCIELNLSNKYCVDTNVLFISAKHSPTTQGKCLLFRDRELERRTIMAFTLDNEIVKEKLGALLSRMFICKDQIDKMVHEKIKDIIVKLILIDFKTHPQ